MRQVVEIWDVILLSAGLGRQPQRWRFSRDGVEFCASIEDSALLSAVGGSTYPLLATGAEMRIEIEFLQHDVGFASASVSGSCRVLRVLNPAEEPPIPLFLRPRVFGRRE